MASTREPCRCWLRPDCSMTECVHCGRPEYEHAAIMFWNTKRWCPAKKGQSRYRWGSTVWKAPEGEPPIVKDATEVFVDFFRAPLRQGSVIPTCKNAQDREKDMLKAEDLNPGDRLRRIHVSTTSGSLLVGDVVEVEVVVRDRHVYFKGYEHPFISLGNFERVLQPPSEIPHLLPGDIVRCIPPSQWTGRWEVVSEYLDERGGVKVRLKRRGSDGSSTVSVPTHLTAIIKEQPVGNVKVTYEEQERPIEKVECHKLSACMTEPYNNYLSVEVDGRIEWITKSDAIEFLEAALKMVKRHG